MWGSDHTPRNSPQPSSAASSPYATFRKRGKTSPAVSALKKPKLDDNSMMIEIDKFLECSVCLDFPASPIHSCDNAHILCGQCAPKLNACPTCKLPTLSPSPVAEKLAKEAKKKMECPNSEAGCKEGVLSTKFEDHLASCYYREINCDFPNYANFTLDCGLKVQFHEYTKHLEQVHKRSMLLGPKITLTYHYDEKAHKSWEWDAFYKWPNTLIKFASHEFMIHALVSKQSQLFFTWVIVQGDKDLADKYCCDVKFKNSKASKKFGSKWTLPVLAFHEIPSNASEAKLFEYSGGSAVSAAPMAALRNWGKLVEGKLNIAVIYEIKDA